MNASLPPRTLCVMWPPVVPTIVSPEPSAAIPPATSSAFVPRCLVQSFEMATAVAGTSRARSTAAGAASRRAMVGRVMGTLLETWSAQHRASVQPHRSSGARRGTGGCRMPPMTASTVVPDRPDRRAGVIRRALRREATRIREPKRLAAMLIIAVVFAIAIAGMWARGENAGGDAQAYWAAVRIWLEGGDPYHPTGPFLPYVYAPWMLPLFIPWALLPWDVAWFVWRGGTILLLLWSIRWAYTRRPLPTAILVLILSFPTAGNLDTGNINLLLALALFGAQFVGPKAGGLIWGLRRG